MSLSKREITPISRPLFVLALISIAILVLVAVLFGPGQSVAGADPGAGSQAGVQGAQGIVTSVFKAPVVADGNVAGAPTDIVITLDDSLDPAVEGRTLLAGNQIRITLPDDFVNVRDWEGHTVFSPGCAGFQCNTGIFLQGWPQHPIFPMFPPGSNGGTPVFYESSLDKETNTFIFTALQDVKPGLDFDGPGIKQIHLLALGYDNPGPGFYDILVEAETGTDGALETGSARVQIYPSIRPSINVTSVSSVPGNPNRIYQQTTPGSPTPLPYLFLLWDSLGEPLLGVEIAMINANHGLMKQGPKTVGHVYIKAPGGASGHKVESLGPSLEGNAPVSGVPTAYLTAEFFAGSETGRYETTFALNNGNSATMVVDVRNN